jgi:hypothetical protein
MAAVLKCNGSYLNPAFAIMPFAVNQTTLLNEVRGIFSSAKHAPGFGVKPWGCSSIGAAYAPDRMAAI